MGRVTRVLAAAVAIGMAACGGDDADADRCGIGPGEGNDALGRATSYALGEDVVGCIGTRTDVHVYAITAPGDLMGGFVQVSVIGAGGLRTTIHAGAGTTELARFVSPEGSGATATFFLAVAPGERYRLAVASEGSFAAPHTYSLATSYTKVPDSFEPNDTLDTAAHVAQGVPHRAYLFAGRHDEDDDPDAYDDYYRFSVTAEMVTITLDDVPLDVAPRISLFGPDGMERARVATGIRGGRLMMQTRMALRLGDHFIRVAPWSGAPESTGIGSTLPDHFTRPYRLMVTQP